MVHRRNHYHIPNKKLLPMMTLKTNICSLSRGEINLLNKNLLKVCKKLMGQKKGLKVKTTIKGVDFYGQYVPNEKTIVIYKTPCQTMDKYVSTFIHEYRHAKQKRLSIEYQFYHLSVGYWKNPFEVDARHYEKTLRPEVWKQVKKLYKKNLEPNLLRD